MGIERFQEGWPGAKIPLKTSGAVMWRGRLQRTAKGKGDTAPTVLLSRMGTEQDTVSPEMQRQSTRQERNRMGTHLRANYPLSSGNQLLDKLALPRKEVILLENPRGRVVR